MKVKERILPSECRAQRRNSEWNIVSIKSRLYRIYIPIYEYFNWDKTIMCQRMCADSKQMETVEKFIFE